MFQYVDYLISTTVDSINNGVIKNGIETPTENNMHMDDNPLVDT